MARVPLGVAFLAVLNLLAGILILVGSSPIFSEFSYLVLAHILQSVQYGMVLIAVIYIALGLGLLSLARWAWYADIIFAMLNLLIIALGVIGPGGTLNLSNISWISLLLNLIIVLYLNQESIKRKFYI